jgi:peptidoglycan/LPS O-acetylase OafA/YrhL
MDNAKGAKADLTSGGRLQFLDLLRGVAALLVVFDHSFNVPVVDDLIHKYFDTGRLGVTVFFLVSGFVIPLTLERRASIIAFVVNRFFRLYPLFWLSIVGVAAWVVFRIPLTPVEYYQVFETHLLRNLLINATMLQEAFHIPNAIPVYWTLTIELAFYVCCVLLFRFGYLKRSTETAWAVWTIVLLVAVVLPCIIRHRVPFEHIFAFVTFFLGTVVYRNYHGLVSDRRLITLTVAVVSLAMLGTACNYYFFTTSSELVTPQASATTYLASFLAFFVVYANRSRKFPAVFLWLGRISYSVYLLHPLVIELSVYTLGELARFTVGLPATLAVSTLTYKYIESPAIKMGHRLARRFHGAELPTAASASQPVAAPSN